MYDLFVIGAGSGGVRSARLAASEGFNVGIAESSRIGGTCVIRGCVPKKLMVYAAEFNQYFSDSKGYGWSVKDVDFDWDKMMTARNNEIERLETIYKKNLKNSGVEIYENFAKLKGLNEVELDILPIAFKGLDEEKLKELKDMLPGKKQAMYNDDLGAKPQPKREVDNARKLFVDAAKAQEKSGAFNLEDILSGGEMVE